MSKNVAVFVDVANIFYAAKTAGVDIDYVTLLKSATAGRDFVRAYAYTGLDPENENQKNFHDFLRRSNYKVVSKDIRKYGDGRIKANLDIELVVDLMRMATHIDIAVVVSGDGDFAPAIRAVQQMGVRVVVISFTGNTSSDLKEVADEFLEITEIARVEKGVRSGRRVAAHDDLSMTEVPEKETDLGPRRRRGGRRDERPAVARAGSPMAAPVSVEGGLPGNIIVLPGERLSRAPDADEEPDLELEVVADAPESGGQDADSEEGRRRRRRRGGRGRGRGRRPEGEVMVGEEITGELALIDEDELLDADELAPLPQHSTFGSVWDSQIGVPVSAGQAAPYEHDEGADEDEPEIPEYLLAERRAQGRSMNRGRSNNRPGRTSGGYQTAVDRERYGRSGSSVFGGGGGGSRMPDRPRTGQGQGGNQGGQRPGAGRPPRPPRMPRPVMSEPRREQERPAPSAEPWSEVPPEVQELLRQEQLRRQAAVRPMSVPPARTEADVAPVSPVASEAPAVSRGRRTRAAAPVSSPVAAPDEAAPASRRRVTRATAAPVSDAAPAAPVSDAAPAEPVALSRTGATSAAPARRTRPRVAVSATAAPLEPAAQVAPAAAVAGAPARRTRAKPAAPVEAPSAAPEAAPEAPAPRPRRRSTRTTGDTTEG